MSDDYSRLKEFWNQMEDMEPEVVDSKFVEDEKFNEIIEKYVPLNGDVLDYGCGSGWASFEIWFSKKVNSVIATDTAAKGIEYAAKCAEVSGLDKIRFMSGDESLLSDYPDYFDFAITINVLDVLPDEIIGSILEKLHFSVKKNGYVFVGMNPDFSEKILLENLQMEKKGKYFYKNGILRCNKKSIDEWKNVFSEYFEVVDNFEFCVVPEEKSYPRIGFILRNVGKGEHA